MGLFRKKSVEDTTPVPENTEAVFEIVANKNARKEVIQEAHAISKKVNSLLVENGFHIKMYLAAGGNYTPKNAARGKK